MRARLGRNDLTVRCFLPPIFRAIIAIAGNIMKLFNPRKIYKEFPQRFWIVVGVSFIDHVGGTMLFPFFSLYITQKFGVGMTEAGIVLGLFAIAGLVGQMIGGALTDKFGRRKLIIGGLVFSALSTLSLGFVNKFSVLIPLAIGIGLLSDIAGPAHGAMIADILPENKRQEGFGVLRVVGNMAWIIGPTIGGFVAGKSFLALFITDAIISCVVAVLFYFLISETKPEPHPDHVPEGLLKTFAGYRNVLRNWAFMAFLMAGMLMGIVYQQMYNSLSVFLRDNHGIDPQGYGFMLTASAIVVILFQFSVTRYIKHETTLCDHGGRYIVLYGRVQHVRICRAVLDVRGCHRRHHRRRNAGGAHQSDHWPPTLRRKKCADATWVSSE